MVKRLLLCLVLLQAVCFFHMALPAVADNGATNAYSASSQATVGSGETVRLPFADDVKRTINEALNLFGNPLNDANASAAEFSKHQQPNPLMYWLLAMAMVVVLSLKRNKL